MNFRKIGKLHYLLMLLAGIIAVYVYFFSYLNSSYAPYYGDEHFYFKNSESFYLTNSLKAVFTYTGLGSQVLGVDAHGPAYPIIYGSISKLVGWGGMNIPLINISLLLIALLALIWNKKTSKNIKALQVLLILGNPITLFYSVTYLPELLQTAGAIGLFLFIQRYQRGGKLLDFLLLLLFIFLLGSIRSTWFFAMFGMILFPGPIKGKLKAIYLILAIALPFILQHFFHEQVPNTFSGLEETIKAHGYLVAFDTVVFNLKRNIYFALHYTEGHFYTAQKIWIAATILYTVLFYREEKIMMSGVLILCSIIFFNILLYKNYTWVDLRMYTPMCLFLNLGIISNPKHQYTSAAFIGINLVSFLLILPLQNNLIHYRIYPEISEIPEKVLEEIKVLETPLVKVDSVILYNYSISQLPAETEGGDLIHYILPYYEMKMECPSHIIEEKNGQLKVRSMNILNQ